MARYSPQTDYFSKAMTYKRYYNYFFWIVFVLSIGCSIFNKESFINIGSIISLIVLSLLDIVIKQYQEKGEQKRRKDFIDNSFGTKFNHEPSIEYYDNEEIEKGLYKILVNLFENSYFSLEISKKMKDKCLYINILCSLVVIIMAIKGFYNSKIALPLLQLFISRYFILNLITLNKFSNKVEGVFDAIKEIFDGNKDSIGKKEAKILRLLVEYETNISDCKLFLDSKIYNELNPILTTKWDEMKRSYGIK